MTARQKEDSSRESSIRVIGVGGTISLELENGRATATDNLDWILSRIDMPSPGITLSSQSLLSKDSVEVTLEDIVTLANTILHDAADYDAFIVTTGTDTMEEVAYGLHLLLKNRCKVVVTGAMRPPYLPDFDGHQNLSDAVSVCTAMRPEQAGVFLSMSGNLIAAQYALKESTVRLQAFVSTSEAHPALKIHPNMSIPAPGKSTANRTIKISNGTLPNVEIINASVGSRIHLHLNSLPDGLIVSCPGAYSLSEAILIDLKPMLQAKKPVVLASRCVQSARSLNECYPGYLAALESTGLLIKDYQGLSPQKARLKLIFQ